MTPSGKAVKTDKTTATDVPVRAYTREEVKKHNTLDDCWIIINGSVYDVTTFMKDDHPGGQYVIYQYAGQDCTEEFRDIGHSRDAVELMKNFRVGTIAAPPATPPTAPPTGKT